MPNCNCINVQNAHTIRRKPVPHNPLKSDPSRSKTLRRVLEQEFLKRLNQLKRDIWNLVVVEDVFGLKQKRTFNKEQSDDRVGNSAGQNNVSGGANREYERSKQHATKNTGRNFILCKDIDKVLNAANRVANQRFQFLSTSEQVVAFQQWLQMQVDTGVLGGAQLGRVDDAYWTKFVEEGYRKGQGRAFIDSRPAAAAISASDTEALAFFEGTKAEFLQSSFGSPVAVGKVKLLAGRVFTELNGVTVAMSQGIARGLTEGLARGESPFVIARKLQDTVEGIGKRRATLIARTEIIRAHAEGQLDAFERLGVEKVGVAVEWSTAGDDRVCPLCQPLEGIVMTLKEARGIIPRHPQCVVGESVIKADDVLTLLKTHYTGEIIELVTSKGCRLSVTANHILLTEYGFLPARFAYEGLKVVSAPAINSNSVITPNNNTSKTHIADIFTTLSKNSAMFSESVPLASEDLHGDGGSCNSEVNIIWPNCKLWDQFDTLRDVVEREFPFFQLLHATAALSSSSSITQFLKSAACASDSSMGRFRELQALLLGRLLHSRKHSLAPVAGINPRVLQSLIDSSTAAPEAFRQCLDTHPILKQFNNLDRWEMTQVISWILTSDILSGLNINTTLFESSADSVVTDSKSLRQLFRTLPYQVSLDQIVSVDVVHVSNLPVYDVQTDSTLYQVNGIVTSNCRCAFLPANLGEDKRGQIRTKGGIDKALSKSIGRERPKFQMRDVPGEFTPTGRPRRVRIGKNKTTIAQQKNKSKWLGADTRIKKTRPKDILEGEQ